MEILRSEIVRENQCYYLNLVTDLSLLFYFFLEALILVLILSLKTKLAQLNSLFATLMTFSPMIVLLTCLTFHLRRIVLEGQ